MRRGWLATFLFGAVVIGVVIAASSGKPSVTEQPTSQVEVDVGRNQRDEDTATTSMTDGTSQQGTTRTVEFEVTGLT